MIVEPELPDHPDYRLLKKVVGPFAMEALVRIWGHCQSNRRGERWEGKDSDYVEAVAQWDGERGTLFRALVDYGWIIPFDGGVCCHNWEKMNAGMIRSRSNGSKGGRPRKSLDDNAKKPSDNPDETQTKPTNNPDDSRLSPGFGGGSTDISGKPTGYTEVNPDAIQVNLDETSPVVSCRVPSGSKGGVGETDDYTLATGRIALLNALTGAKFNLPFQELDTIIGRLLETNRDAAGIDKMLRRQVALWRTDPRMRHNLKPTTLFGSNFHDYYGQRDQPIAVEAPNKNGGFDHADALQSLASARRRLEQAPAAAVRAELQYEIATLEAQLA